MSRYWLATLTLLVLAVVTHGQIAAPVGSQGFGGSAATCLVPDVGPTIPCVISVGGVEQVMPDKSGKISGAITVSPAPGAGAPVVACVIPLAQICSIFTAAGCRDYGFVVPDPCNPGFQVTVAAHMCDSGQFTVCCLFDNTTPGNTQTGWVATACISPGPSERVGGPSGVFTAN